MHIEKLSNAWLFQQHTQQTVKKWVQQLRFFYFKRAWGGQANDGDEFQVAFLFTDKQDLIHKVEQLGLTLPTMPNDSQNPLTTTIYSPSKIPQFPDLAQLGHCIVFGHKAFVWVNNYSIHIGISGTKDNNYYEVTEDDFNACLELEKHFEHLDWQKNLDKSLEENVCCLSRIKYPELYEE